MKVTSIVPCIRVTKENYMIGFNMYIEEGDMIEVIDNEDHVFSGAFRFLQLVDDGEEGRLYLSLENGEEVPINTWDIKDIVEPSN